MKRIIFVLCIFFILANIDNAAAFYNCVDKDGNSFITDNPPQDAKCKSKEVDDESSSGGNNSAGRGKGDAEVQQTGKDPKTQRQQDQLDRLKSIKR